MGEIVFFTGFPGFLGSELLPRVLARHGASVRALCLIQREFRAVAEERLRSLTTRYPPLQDRVELREGDIVRSDLGLSGLGELSEQVVEVFHLAAIYDLAVAREPALRVNVLGTENMLHFAGACRQLRRFQYMSTCYVSGRYAGAFTEEDLDRGAPFNNYYEETKHLAEVAVRKSMAAGLPATIYRPSIVVGDSRSGATQKYDGPYYIIQLLLRQKEIAIAPVLGRARYTRVNVAPRDFVVDAVAELSGQERSLGRTYALADPEALTVREMLSVLAQATGRQLIRAPLPAMLARKALENIAPLQQWMRIPPEALDYFTHPTYYTCTNALRDLANSGIRCPRFADYAPTLVQYMREHPEIPTGGMS